MSNDNDNKAADNEPKTFTMRFTHTDAVNVACEVFRDAEKAASRHYARALIMRYPAIVDSLNGLPGDMRLEDALIQVAKMHPEPDPPA